MTVPNYPVSIPVNRDEVPDAGVDITFRADEGQREAFARYLGVPRVDRVEADLRVEQRARRALAVSGRVSCDLVQTCVVTLEPVAATIDEPVAIRYVPEAGRGSVEGDDMLAADDVDTEPMEGGRIDVGAVIAQSLALGLDPYPRKPGVVFEGVSGAEEEAQRTGAFADLAKLRREGGGS